MKQLKHIITFFMLLVTGMTMAQTQPNRPTGATPYGSLWITPDGLVWSGSASVGYTAVGSKADYEALINAGYSIAQIDSIALDVYNRARDRDNHTGTQAISTIGGLDSALDSKIPQSEKGAANGVATLDVNSKVPMSQVPDALIGSVNYQGNWNPSTNSPTLPTTPGASTKGHYYIASTTGIWNGIEYNNGDWIISNGSDWGKVDNNNKVVSVAGKQGAVVIVPSDIIGLQSFLDGQGYLKTETDPTVSAWAKQPTKPSYTFGEIVAKPSTLSGYGITDAVHNTRSIIAGVGLSGGGDLSDNRTLSVDGTVVRTSGDQPISGVKSFSTGLYKAVSGNSNIVGSSYGVNGFSYEHPAFSFMPIAGMEAVNYNTTGSGWAGVASRISMGLDLFVTNQANKVRFLSVTNEGVPTFLQDVFAPGGSSANWNTGYSNSVSNLTFNNTTRVLTLNRPSGNLSVSIPETGGGGSSGVNSVGLSAPTGFSVSGSPVTSSGTLALTFASGYSLPTTSNQTNWSSAYSWGNHASAGYALSSRSILTGDGLSGGGNLTADRTLSVDGTVVRTSGKQTISGVKSFFALYKEVSGNSSTIGDSFGVNGFSYEHPSYPIAPIAGMEAINYNTTGSGWAGIASRVTMGLDLFVTKEGNRVRATRIDSDGLATFDNIVTAPSFNGALNASQLSTGTVPFARLPTGTGASQVAIGNHNHTFSNLNGVSLSSPTSGQYLTYNGTNWVNSTLNIPTVNNGTLTLATGNGLTGSATFTANQGGNSTFTVAPVFGTAANTIAQGNDIRIINGQTAFGWGNHAGLYLPINGTATSANTLATARTINGTSFNGSANITTANWGTARTLSYTGDVTGSSSVNGSTNVATGLTIANSAVTHAKYQNISTQRILGRGATGTGNVQELTLGDNLSLSTAGVLSATNTNTTYSAGNGLVLTGNSFAVGAGSGITVNGANVAVDNTVLRTTGNQTKIGDMTFTSPVTAPNATDPGHLVTKAQLDAVDTKVNDSYSTSELATGATWINGKPIFKRTINTGAISGNKTVEHNIILLETIVKIEGSAASSSSSMWYGLPYVSATGGVGSNISVSVQVGNIVITTSTTGITSSYVTLYYTKGF